MNILFIRIRTLRTHTGFCVCAVLFFFTAFYVFAASEGGSLADFYHLQTLWNDFADMRQNDADGGKSDTALEEYTKALRSLIRSDVAGEFAAFVLSEIVFYTDVACKEPFLRIMPDEDFTGLMQDVRRKLEDSAEPSVQCARALFSVLAGRRNNGTASRTVQPADLQKNSDPVQEYPLLPSAPAVHALLLRSFSELAHFTKEEPSVERAAALLNNPGAAYVLFNADEYAHSAGQWRTLIEKYAEVFGNSVFDDINAHARAVYKCRALVGAAEREARIYGFPVHTILPSGVSNCYDFVRSDLFAASVLSANELERLNRCLEYAALCGALYVRRCNRLLFRNTPVHAKSALAGAASAAENGTGTSASGGNGAGNE